MVKHFASMGQRAEESIFARGWEEVEFSSLLRKSIQTWQKHVCMDVWISHTPYDDLDCLLSHAPHFSILSRDNVILGI